MEDGKIVEQIITWIILVVGLGGNYTFMKRSIDRIEAKMDEAERRYHACRETLPHNYASKENVLELYERIRETENTLSYIKGKANGNGNGAAMGGKIN